MAHVLIVDDEKNYLVVLQQLLEEAGYRVSCAENPYAALELLNHDVPDVILSDLRMPRMNGLDFMTKVRECCGEIPFIVLTAYATVETALETIKQGAFDYLTKPFTNDEILLVVKKALDFRRLNAENLALRHQLDRSSARQLLGESPEIRNLLDNISRVASSRASILIVGETGTGKELVANILHQSSPRRNAALVSVNCATLPETLLESELFGHERGAFSSAVERKLGLFEIADGGTLFLDEIGEMPLPLQTKLLRVLEDGRFRRLGGTTELHSDVRVVAATHRNLEQLLVNGGFREDLYYRLNVVTLEIPPLRERKDDLPLLALHFLQLFYSEMGKEPPRITREAMAAFKAYHWPGNVRELRNVLERASLFCQGPQLGLDDLPERFPVPDAAEPASAPSLNSGATLPEQVEAFERELIQQALIQTRGVQAQAAELLGISRSNLQYKLKKLGLS